MKKFIDDTGKFSSYMIQYIMQLKCHTDTLYICISSYIIGTFRVWLLSCWNYVMKQKITSALFSFLNSDMKQVLRVRQEKWAPFHTA